MEIIFETFSDFFKKINEEDSGLGDLGDIGLDDEGKDKKKEDKEDADKKDAEEVERLDKEAYILAKTDKNEDDLKDLSDEEIDAMYIGIKSNEKVEKKQETNK